MKKIILLFVAAISICISSCQTDDDVSDPAESQDKFVGTWMATKDFVNGIEESSDDICSEQDRFIISLDNQFSTTSYVNENGNCVLEETFNGTWENLGDNTYKMVPEDDDYFPIELKVTFLEDTMIIEYTDDDEEFKTIMKRV